MLLQRKRQEDGQIRVKVLGMPASGRWNVPQKVLMGGLALGWLAINGGRLTVRTVPGTPDLEFAIEAQPNPKFLATKLIDTRD